MKTLHLSRVPASVFPYKFLNKNKQYILTEKRFFEEYYNSGYQNCFSIENYTKGDNLVNSALELIRKEDINIINPVDEFDIIPAAIIREKLNMSGQNLESAVNFRDKYYMKNSVSKICNVPEYTNITSKDSITEFIDLYNFPIIVKPRKLWGSNKIVKIENNSQLINWIKNNDKKLENYMIENWVNYSKMIIVDGIQNNNKLIWHTISEYDKGCLESIKSNEGLCAFNSELSNDSDFMLYIKKYTENILKLLNKENLYCSPIHMELFIDNESNEIIFNEIASRFGGGNTIERINTSYEFNIAKFFINKITNYSNEDLVSRDMKYFVGDYMKYNIKDIEALENIKNESWIERLDYDVNKKDARKLSNINDIKANIIFKTKNLNDFKNYMNIIRSL